MKKRKKNKRNKRLPVLLLDDIVNLGQKGEVVMVKPGYFKYLFSLGKIKLATQEKLSGELKPLLLETKVEKRKLLAERLKDELEKLVLEFRINKYSSITREKISKALKDKGINIPKANIALEQKIKESGEYNIAVKLGHDIISSLKVIIKY